MNPSQNKEVLRQVLKLRAAQMIINEYYKKGIFKVPIHLALGHEAIAVAVDQVMQPADQIALSHRNIHYNLARLGALKAELDEYLLKPEGLASGQLGSMNLTNEAKGLIYTSSILGNNLAVAAGLATAKKVKEQQGIVMVVTGDGAIEEGSFYESLVFEKSNDLAVMIIIENNEWSLGTCIQERRCPIDIAQITGALNIPFKHLTSNDVFEYIQELSKLREESLKAKTPVVVQVDLATLGSWYMKSPEQPEAKGRFINYHAGPAPTVALETIELAEQPGQDPVRVMEKYFSKADIEKILNATIDQLNKEIA